MSKKSVIELLKSEMESISKKISVMESLELKKIYKVTYLNSQWNHTTHNMGYSPMDIILKVKAFNKDSIRVVPLAIEAMDRLGISWRLSSQINEGKIDPELTLDATLMSEVKDWGTFKDHIAEAPLYVNYEYLSHSMKKGLFGSN